MLPTRPELADDIVRALAVRLLDPLEILLDGHPSLDRVQARLREQAEIWAERLLDGNRRTVVATLVRLTAALYPSDVPFDPPLAWWRTPMGQVTAHRIGHPTAEGVSYPVAGAMLGITRQGVHDLVVRGKLARHPDGGVLSSSIRDRLHQEGHPLHATR